jgi:hypothetical protein
VIFAFHLSEKFIEAFAPGQSEVEDVTAYITTGCFYSVGIETLFKYGVIR